jgi:hypothetical protein
MPVHSIFAACGDVVYWYEQNQCVSYRNRLYFVIDIGVNQCQTLLTAAVSKELTPGDVIFDNEPDDMWRRYNWPVPDFSIGFQLISSDTSIPDYKLCCFLMCERVVNNGGVVQYMDKINPAFRRLQRWVRTLVWKKRKEQRLQFALAAHKWLKNDVLQTIGIFIK